MTVSQHIREHIPLTPFSLKGLSRGLRDSARRGRWHGAFAKAENPDCSSEENLCACLLFCLFFGICVRQEREVVCRENLLMVISRSDAVLSSISMWVPTWAVGQPPPHPRKKGAMEHTDLGVTASSRMAVLPTCERLNPPVKSDIGFS